MSETLLGFAMIALVVIGCAVGYRGAMDNTQKACLIKQEFSVSGVRFKCEFIDESA